MKNRVRLKVVLLVIIASLLVVGCLGNKEKPAPEPTTAPASTESDEKTEESAAPTKEAPAAPADKGKLIVSNYIGDAELIIGGSGKSPNGDPLTMDEYKVSPNGTTTIELAPGDYNWYVNTGSTKCKQCTLDGWVQIFAGETAKLGFYIDVDNEALQGGAE